jgi:hypothetical protein
MTPDVAVVIPLNNPVGPADDTVTAEYPLLSPKSYDACSGGVVCLSLD